MVKGEFLVILSIWTYTDLFPQSGATPAVSSTLCPSSPRRTALTRCSTNLTASVRRTEHEKLIVLVRMHEMNEFNGQLHLHRCAPACIVYDISATLQQCLIGHPTMPIRSLYQQHRHMHRYGMCCCPRWYSDLTIVAAGNTRVAAEARHHRSSQRATNITCKSHFKTPSLRHRRRRNHHSHGRVRL